MSAEASSADRAVSAVLRRIRDDGRVAYFLGYGSETFNLLTAAYAEAHGEDVDEFRKRFWALCSPERPGAKL